MRRYRAERAIESRRQLDAQFTFNIIEVFAWVCDKQGIRNAEHLADARWNYLWRVAEQTTRKLNALFAAEKVEA